MPFTGLSERHYRHHIGFEGSSGQQTVQPARHATPAPLQPCPETPLPSFETGVQCALLWHGLCKRLPFFAGRQQAHFGPGKMCLAVSFAASLNRVFEGCNPVFWQSRRRFQHPFFWPSCAGGMAWLRCRARPAIGHCLMGQRPLPTHNGLAPKTHRHLFLHKTAWCVPFFHPATRSTTTETFQCAF